MKNTCRQFLNSFTLVWMPQLEIQILNGSTKAVSLHICCNSHSSDSEYLIWLGVVAYAPFCRWEPLQIASEHRPGGGNWDSGDLSPLALAGISIPIPTMGVNGVGADYAPLDSVVPTWFFANCVRTQARWNIFGKWAFVPTYLIWQVFQS